MSREGIRDFVENELRANGLEVKNEVYSLAPDFTPNHHVLVVEMPDRSGVQLRVLSDHVAKVEVAWAQLNDLNELGEAVQVAVRHLMEGQLAIAQKWLAEHPEAAE